MSPTWDAAVVGGGLAGRAAAITLAKAGLATLHLSPRVPPDRRTSALMQPSVDLLQHLGVAPEPARLGEPLRRIRIIDATGRLMRAPETLFDSSEAGLEAFGWNFGNLALGEALESVAATLPGLATRDAAVARVTFGDPAQLTLVDGDTVAAHLVVGADGRNSLVRRAAGIAVRERPFAQAALVCDLTLGRPLNGESVEFHYDNGPFTLVPAGGSRANLVWVDQRATLDAAREARPEALLEILHERSRRLFGSLALASPAVIFPLSTLSVATAGRGCTVLVGEAAHAFPPIGAQGLNLGLRDIADLAAAVAQADRSLASWAGDVSDDYAGRRSGDLARTGAAVDLLFRSLLAEMLPAQAVRAGGLWALKLLPMLRRQAFSVGMGVR